MKEGLSEMTTKRSTKKKQPKRRPASDPPRPTFLGEMVVK